MSALRVVGIALAAVMMTLVLKKENGAAALADEDRLAADISELREMLFTYLKG